MSDERVPIDHVLPGMGLHPLQSSYTPVEAFVIIKVLDDEGGVSWAFRTTHTPNRRELLGALIEQTDLLRERLQRDWDDDDDN